MTPVPGRPLLQRIADTKPGEAIDIPEAAAAGLLWRMANALISTHDLIAAIKGDQATLTFTHPLAMEAWTDLLHQLGLDA